MRSLLIINPNTTAAMTEQMAAAAARLLPEGIALEALTAERGAPVIASRASYAVAAEAVLETYARARRPHCAVVIGCFGDPGLEALRALARQPVLGLAEASIREADALGEPFAILTMGRAWVEMLNERVALASVKTPFVGVFAAEGTGLDCQPPGSRGRRRTGPPCWRGRRVGRANAHPWRRRAHGNGGAPQRGRPSDRLHGRDCPRGAQGAGAFLVKARSDFGFSWPGPLSLWNPPNQGLEKLGFPWILSSES